MAQTTSSKSAAEGAAHATEGTAHAVATTGGTPPGPIRILKPVVYERTRSGKNKKKKRHSRFLKDPQLLEEDASRAVERLAQAAADGVSEYRDNRDKSARRKRDGAIKDIVRNVGRGLSEALDTAAQAPADLTRRATSRRLTRLVPPPFSYFVRWR